MLDRGLWIAFEGPDGTGKTTIMQTVASMLQSYCADLEILQTAHPGSTPLGKHLRILTKEPHKIDKNIHLDVISEQLLMVVDHVNFKAQILEPALERCAIVLADRCNLVSSIAYGMTAGLTATQLNAMFHLATQPRVDKLYLLHCPDRIRQQRLVGRDGEGAADRFERRAGVAAIYDSMLTGSTERTILLNRVVSLDNIQYVDSSRPVDQIANDIFQDIRATITNHEL